MYLSLPLSLSLSLFVMSCLLITLAKCLKVHKSLWSVLEGVLLMYLSLSLSLYLYLLVMSCLLASLTKYFKGHESLGQVLEGVLSMYFLCLFFGQVMSLSSFWSHTSTLLDRSLNCCTVSYKTEQLDKAYWHHFYGQGPGKEITFKLIHLTQCTMGWLRSLMTPYHIRSHNLEYIKMRSSEVRNLKFFEIKKQNFRAIGH